MSVRDQEHRRILSFCAADAKRSHPGAHATWMAAVDLATEAAVPTMGTSLATGGLHRLLRRSRGDSGDQEGGGVPWDNRAAASQPEGPARRRPVDGQGVPPSGCPAGISRASENQPAAEAGADGFVGGWCRVGPAADASAEREDLAGTAQGVKWPDAGLAVFSAGGRVTQALSYTGGSGFPHGTKSYPSMTYGGRLLHNTRSGRVAPALAAG